MNNKKIIISMMLTLILLIGGTYAYIYFFTEKTAVTMMVDGDRISFNVGENITVSGIVPVYRMEEGVAKEIEIYKENGKYQAGIELFLELTSWPTSFSSNSLRWSLYKNDNYLSSGDFSSTKQGNKIKLTSYSQKINLEEDKDKYKLYIWIDAYTESSVDMMNQSFTVNVYGQVTFYDENEVTVNEVEPNAPDLADGMIPIRYNYIIDEWQKADSTNTDNNWYDYNNKMWANAVLVDTESREGYMTADVGTTVDEEDILAYYVWIPRYKYVIFNVNSEMTEPREIQIEFEKTTDLISEGEENGEFLSHPAFWWDNDSNGVRASDGSEELSGIWVGKFETGGSVNKPLIKPNIIATDNLNILNLFTMNSNVRSTAYLTEMGVSEVDPHMMKNTQWGAVAYLSHSRYGFNSNIETANTSFTGRYNDYTYNDYIVSNGKITPSKLPGTGVLTSTTGNVYGIYDMVGGQYEYVMAMMKKAEDNETPKFGSSGFNVNNKPLSKYYDLYEYGASHSDSTRRILGDATGETKYWYIETAYSGRFLNETLYFFIRGREFISGSASAKMSSIFSYTEYDYSLGKADALTVSRAVIVLP